MPVIALSTCWNSPRHTDGYEMIAEIAALGFSHVELSHGVRLSLVPGIVRALEEKLVKVGSTHNFCPLPPGVNSAAPNMFLPSSDDERIAVQWDRYTRRSIDFARQVGASVVVAHLGAVEFGWFNPSHKVTHLLEQRRGRGTDNLDKLRRISASTVQTIRKRRSTPWQALFRRLEPVLVYAKENGITLGGENREKIDELPLDADFAELLERFGAGSGLAAWHDTGHAHLKAKMGLIEHEQLLETTAPRLAGFHVHDVRGFKDHLPPGTGDIDFGMIARYVRPNHILVLELNPRLNPTEVVESRAYLTEKLGLGR